MSMQPTITTSTQFLNQSFRLGVKLLVLVLSTSTLLMGCSLFGGDDDESAQPAELVEFNETLPVERIWRTSIGAGADKVPVNISPVFDNGKIYIADRKGRISIINADTGSIEQRINSKLRISAGPSVSGNLLMVGTLDGEVFVFNTDNGEVQWRSPVSSEVLARPVLHDGYIIVRCIDGRIFGFDAQTGQREWLYDRGVPLLSLRGTSHPLVRGGVAYIGYDGGEVVALRVNDGVVLWEQVVSNREGKTDLERLADIDGDMAIIANDLYVTSSRGRLAALTVDSGRILWVKDAGSSSGITVARTMLALSDRQSQVWMVDRINSTTLWKQDLLLNRGTTRPTFYLNYTVVADVEGYLHFMDTESGNFVARTKVDGAGVRAAPLAVGTTLYVLSEDGSVSAYRAGAAI